MKKQFLLMSFFVAVFTFQLSAVCTWTGMVSDLWSEPMNWDCGHVPTMMDPVIITGAMVTLDISTGAKTLELDGGSITAPGGEILTVFEGMAWKSGTISASLVLKGPSMSGMITGGAKVLKKAILVEAGSTLTWDGGPFFIDGGATLSVDGEFAGSFGGTIDFGTASPGKIVVADGIFLKAGGAGTMDVSVDVENSGAIAVTAGKVKLWNGLPANMGDLSIASGTFLEIVGGSEHDAGIGLFGTGTLELTGTGTHDLNFAYTGGMSYIFDATTVTLDAAISSSGTVTIKSGTVGGTGSLSVSGMCAWEKGTIDLPATIPIMGTLTVSGTDDKVLTNTLTMAGMATWSGGDIYINTPGSWINSGTTTTSHDKRITAAMGMEGSFSNSGTFKKSGGTGFSTFAIPYTNTGTTDISTGTLQFDKPATFTSGMLNVDTGAEFETISNVTFAAASSITGTGGMDFQAGTSSISTTSVSAETWSISGGALTMNTNITPANFTATVAGGAVHFLDGINPTSFNFTQSAGTVNFTGTSSPTSSSLTFSGGLIGGGGTLKITDTFNWTDGELGAKVTGTVASTFTFSGSATKKLAANLVQSGSTSWTGGDVELLPGVDWSNSGTLTASSSGSILGTTGSFTNGSTFSKTTISTLSVEPSFVNNGTVKGLGTLTFSNGFTNTGTVAPGLSPGILTKTGDYTNGTLLDLEILDGTGAGTGHDQLIVTNNATLAGTIKVTETGTVPNGSYTVLICQGISPCISGSFSTIDLPAGYTLSMTATEVMVTKSALPIELVDFTAQQKEGDILLNWETASELNNDYFEIERSIDGHYFEKVGEMAGRGTSAISHLYSFLDKNIAETIHGELIYYRLRQIDFDGQFEYSKIVAVNLANKQHGFFVEHIFQNKSGLLEMSINNGLSDSYHPDLFLYSLSGKLIFKQHLFLEKGKNNLQFSVGHLPEGVYLLNIKSAEKQITERVFLK